MWLWQVDSGELLHRLERPPANIQVRSLAFSADSRVIVGAGYATLSYWDVATGRLRHAQSIAARSAVALAPDLSGVAGVGDGYIELRDAIAGQHRLWLTGPVGYATTLAFSPDGRRLAAADGNARLWIWDTRTGQVQAALDRYSPGINGLVFSPDGNTLGWASGYRVWRWDFTTGAAPRPAFEQPLPVNQIAFSPDGRLLAAGSYQPSVRRPAYAAGSQVRVWDFMTGQLVHTLNGHGNAVYALAFSPDGRTLATGGLDTLTRLWDMPIGRAHHVLSGYHTSVVDLAFSPDGQTLYSLAAAWEGCYEACNRVPWVIWAREEPAPLRLWQAATGQLIHVPAWQPGQNLYTIDISPDGHLLAGDTGDGIFLLDARTGEAPRQLTRGGPNGRPTFSPDGRFLITTRERAVVILEAATGRVVSQIEADPFAITSLAISPDGKRLATSGGDGVVRLWQVLVSVP